MRRRIAATALWAAVVIVGGIPAHAADRDWQATERTVGDGPAARRELELRHKIDRLPGGPYRGTVDGGYTVLRDREGNTLRGFVAPDGTAVLRDREGNPHRFTTRPQP
jgi:hypothetical protein